MRAGDRAMLCILIIEGVYVMYIDYLECVLVWECMERYSNESPVSDSRSVVLSVEVLTNAYVVITLNLVRCLLCTCFAMQQRVDSFTFCIVAPSLFQKLAALLGRTYNESEQETGSLPLLVLCITR